MAITISYSDRFQQQEAVTAYEDREYAAGSYASCVWAWQRPVLERTIQDFRATHPGPVRLLDFACGTGRVLSALEPLVDQADGVDISASMVAVAQRKCAKSRLLVGDILAQPELLSGRYDIISCFRFLLNVEPELRRRVLVKLRRLLREPDGRLLVNVHGNARSLRHPAIVWRRRREKTAPSDDMLNEMSPAESKALLAECGFTIVRQFGFGVLPPTLYRTPVRGLARTLDQSLTGDHAWNDWSIDMLFLCRPN